MHLHSVHYVVHYIVHDIYSANTYGGNYVFTLHSVVHYITHISSVIYSEL